MFYSKEEVELTLNLYSIAKLHLREIDIKLQRNQNDNAVNYSYYTYYSHLVRIVDLWTEMLLPDEIQLLELRAHYKKTFNYISIQLGYANHSSVIRKYRSIIYKISSLEWT